MKVMIDGLKETQVQNDLRVVPDTSIIYGMSIDDKTDLEGHIEIVLTHEGIIADVYNNAGECIGTMSQTYGELADDILD